MYSSWAQYTICFQSNSEREQITNILRENNIPSAVYYRKPMHMQVAFKEYGFEKLDYKNTEKICDCCLSLPMHLYLKDEDVRYVINKII